MTSHHGATGWAVFDGTVLVLLALAAAGWAAGLWAARHRGPWPVHRTVLWFAGLLCAGTALVGPLAEAARTGFTAHMAGHLLLGMAAPFLLVLAAPVTLALRALPVARARVVTRLLRTPPVRAVTHPVVAGTFNAGGLWALYTTGLYGLMHASVPVHAAVHLHVLLAGCVFTAAVVGVDPDPHRGSFPLRAAVLVGFVAAHSALAKHLYGHPPDGVGASDARTGAQLMYYGGDVVDVALMVVLFAQWYARPRGGASRPVVRGSRVTPRGPRPGGPPAPPRAPRGGPG
ncbi:cytochrome c oxidase assembly protein [Kocuria himachalensis]